MGHQGPVPCSHMVASWTELDTCCALPRAINLHSQRYNEQTRELHGRIGQTGGRPRRGTGAGLGQWSIGPGRHHRRCCHWDCHWMTPSAACLPLVHVVVRRI